ncbi:WGR and DUF4132 domain-containing protein [Archangium primigenium]|uniref:WGR and DUF4132 domain-containing protein n=1 Tax=[Archangium] primigenium TaxID=2792470 RepID=UPI0019584F5E|nr:WGR and DUF4132 domain-containing protein [Archangium primigenium]MBM7119317.1 WGR and DUF4132 domain-containing protein [Archangium primigenium]
MRRFEFAEGSSRKFWEIALEGTGFTVRWGRLGTDGQTQQKTFPSAQKAQTEHDKLIAEKVKKGYAEAGSAPAPTPTPAPVTAAAPKPKPVAPAPVAPSPEPTPTGPIFWTEDLLRRVHPRRGGVAVPVRALASPKKAWAQAREDFQARIKDVVPDTEPGLLTAETQALAERLKRAEPTPGTPEEDAVLLTVLQHRDDWNHHPRGEPGIDLLFALAGPAHTTRATLLSLDMHVTEDTPPRVRRGTSSNSRSARLQRLAYGGLHGLPRLRALLATQADDAGYQAAREAASALRLTSEQRAASAFLFPTEADWVLTEAQGTHDELPTYLVASVSTLEALTPFLPGVKPYHLMQGDTGLLPSLLDGMGLASFAFFQDIIQRSYLSTEFLREWADHLARLDSDEAFSLLLERSVEHGKEMMASLLEATARAPHRALRLLAPRASTRGKEGEAARSVLTHVLRRQGDALPALLVGQSADVVQLVTRLQEQAGGPDAPDATPEQLPPVLARPPWASGRPTEPPPVLTDVVPPALPDALAWNEREREAWQRHKGYAAQQYEHHTEAQWRDFAQQNFSGKPRTERYAGYHDPIFFALAPESLARPHLEYLFTSQSGLLNNWMPRILANLGLAALPVFLKEFEQNKNDLFPLVMPLALQGLAPSIAEAYASKKFRASAREWLLRHPAHATAGLLVPALGKPGKARDTAGAVLRLLAAEGHEATVLDIAARASPQAREALVRVLAQDPLQLYPAKLPKPPATLGIGSLPAPLLADRSAKLPPSAVEALATLLAFSPLDEPYAGLAQVKAACDRPSLARFAWALFEAWLLAGAPSKEGWCLLALGHLGDDDTARKLAPLIRQWPGEAAHARAVTGLDVLATIGTDVTLIYLNGIAEKVKFKGLQQKAQEKIAQIAETRGLTREELADRLVPDLGLDETGSLALDFGPRAFTVGFDEQLKPFVRDADGTPLKDLPKPTQKDDAEKATAASESWKALKKDAKTAASLQILRLELAMCARRRWSADVFRQFFVEHPLLIHVVRRLVWGTYSPEGALTATFRVAEDRSLADANDDTWSLPEGALVGLPHALELDTATAGAWGQVFADYQLLQPFSQLGRPIYAMTPADKDAKKLDRVKGVKLPTGKVLGLEARGWRRGAPQDGGVACWMEKPLGPERVAYLDLDPGLFTGMLSESPEQTLGEVMLNSQSFWNTEGAQPFGILDPILFSELVRDLEGLRPA